MALRIEPQVPQMFLQFLQLTDSRSTFREQKPGRSGDDKRGWLYIPPGLDKAVRELIVVPAASAVHKQVRKQQSQERSDQRSTRYQLNLSK